MSKVTLKVKMFTLPNYMKVESRREALAGKGVGNA